MTTTKNAHSQLSERAYISTIMKRPLLDRDHEVELARRWRDQQDHTALHELIEAHGRLVVRIAAGFRNSALSFPDLIQEGNVGLMKAAQRFDPERGVRFSTYSTWWILAAIKSYMVHNSSVVRMATTPKMRRLFFNLNRVRARLGGNHGSRLTADERDTVAELLGVSVADIEGVEHHLTGADLSLNAPMAGDSEIQMQDVIPDDGKSPEDIVADERGRRDQRRWIAEALEQLSPREQQIVTRRFLNERTNTLAEIAQDYCLSKERIRQIELRALQKLRRILKGLNVGAGELLAA